MNPKLKYSIIFVLAAGVITGLVFLIKHLTTSICKPSCKGNEKCVNGSCVPNQTDGCHPPCTNGTKCLSN